MFICTISEPRRPDHTPSTKLFLMYILCSVEQQKPSLKHSPAETKIGLISCLEKWTGGKREHTISQPQDTTNCLQTAVVAMLPQTLEFIYPLCNTLIYTQSRGILFHICADMGVCPNTAHLIHKSTVICTLNITIIHMHFYSIK